MILEKQTQRFSEFSLDGYVTNKQLVEILDGYKDFQKELIELYEIDQNSIDDLKIGNTKPLLLSIKELDSQCKKLDIVTTIKDVQLKKLLEDEKALFEIFSIQDDFIVKQNKSDLLIVETRYSAKSDILDYYNFSKFANYCRDKDFEDLVFIIRDYLKEKNLDNDEHLKLRLLYKNDDQTFYLRAKTSSSDYKDFGINFSVFVAVVSLNQYVEKNLKKIFIDHYLVDDSTIYVSFTLDETVKISEVLDLSFNLILENDEVKRSSVSFNGFFKLKFEQEDKSSEIYLKPNNLSKNNSTDNQVDLLTYPHRGSVKNVYKKIKELPILIDQFISQVSEDALKIKDLKHPDDVRKFIIGKVERAQKPEFKAYKDSVRKKLSSITVDNIFKLFELLNEVEALFEHDDIISKNFWRTKLYEALIEKK